MWEMCVAATLDGGLGYVLPVPEKTYRRLLMLQNVLVNHIPHTGGLNPKAFRWADYNDRNFITHHEAHVLSFQTHFAGA
jgi:hypothetical protein